LNDTSRVTFQSVARVGRLLTLQCIEWRSPVAVDRRKSDAGGADADGTPAGCGADGGGRIGLAGRRQIRSFTQSPADGPAISSLIARRARSIRRHAGRKATRSDLVGRPGLSAAEKRRRPLVDLARVLRRRNIRRLADSVRNANRATPAEDGRSRRNRRRRILPIGTGAIEPHYERQYRSIGRAVRKLIGLDANPHH